MSAAPTPPGSTPRPSPWWIERSQTTGIDQVLQLAAPSARHLVQLAPGRLSLTLFRLEGPGLEVDGGRSNLPLRAVGVTPPRGRVTVSFLLEAPGRCTMHGHDMAPGDAVLWPPDLEYDGMAPGGHCWATAILPERTAATLGWEPAEHAPADGGLRATSLSDDRQEELRALLDAVHVWREPEITDLEPRQCRPLRDRWYELLERVFQRVRPVAGPERASGTALRVVRAVEDHWLSQLDRPGRLQGAAAHAGVSPRTVESSFRRILGTTPFQYLELLRAHALFRELRRIDAGAPATVKEAQRRCGVGHPSRFAARYHDVFDEYPSETLQRTRDARGA